MILRTLLVSGDPVQTASGAWCSAAAGILAGLRMASAPCAVVTASVVVGSNLATASVVGGSNLATIPAAWASGIDDASSANTVKLIVVSAIAVEATEETLHRYQAIASCRCPLQARLGPWQCH